MVNKLRFGEERILDQVIAKLETAAALYKRNNISAGKMSQSIAELNAKLVMLEQLRSKGYLAIEVYQSQARDIQKQISDLKSERRNAFESTIQTMLDEVLKMRSLLNEITKAFLLPRLENSLPPLCGYHLDMPFISTYAIIRHLLAE